MDILDSLKFRSFRPSSGFPSLLLQEMPVENVGRDTTLAKDPLCRLDECVPLDECGMSTVH